MGHHARPSGAREEICRHLPSLAPVLPIIRHHHERWDGTGYPDGLRASQIPLLARVLQIAPDIYDALTSQRPYKPALPPSQALRVIQQESDRGWRDPEIVSLFLRLHKDVVSKASQYATLSDRSLQALQAYVGNCQEVSLPKPVSPGARVIRPIRRNKGDGSRRGGR